MTESDWAVLIGRIRGFVDPWRAEAYLRERIEAAFVPVSAAKALMDEKHKQAAEAKLWFTKAQEWREIAARAEAAEARVKVLEEALREIKEMTHRRQLPLTTHINDTATQALGGEHDK